MQNRNEIFATLKHFNDFNIENQDTNSITEICAYLLAPENFARFITDINILETFYNVIVSETEDKNLELLTSLIFQTEHFNHLFYDQPSFEYIVKFCYHNHSFMSPDQKNKVFSLIQTGKIDFHLFITNFLFIKRNTCHDPSNKFSTKK